MFMCPFGFVSHKGKKIAVVDCSNTTAEEAIDIIRDAQQRIAFMSKNSLLVLTVGVNAHYNGESAEGGREFVTSNTLFVRASAVVGLASMNELKDSMDLKDQSRIEVFATQDEAMDWLVKQ